MSEGRTAGSTAQNLGTGLGRLVRAWRVLPYERRLAAAAAVGLFVSLFLPWYQRDGARRPAQPAANASVTGWGAFSFVEAAILLVAVWRPDARSFSARRAAPSIFRAATAG